MVGLRSSTAKAMESPADATVRPFAYSRGLL